MTNVLERLDKMSSGSMLGFINEAVSGFKDYIEENFSHCKVSLENGKEEYVIFVSAGNPSIRARVFTEAGTDLRKIFRRIKKKLSDLVYKQHLNPQWIKLDVVSETKVIYFNELENLIAKTKKNYFRYGIAFDPEFRLAFLEQEINGNAMIREINKKLQLSEKNINRYVREKYDVKFPFIKERYRNKNVILFKTKGIFLDSTDGIIRTLYDGDLMNGIRKTDSIEEEVKFLIEKATYFLVNMLKEDGKFEYGYFANFAKKIGTYNILRHSSSLYAMAEGYEVLQDEKIIRAVERGIDYLIQEAVVYKNEDNMEMAFVVDHANENEIKLGSNATAILAMTKYMELTGSRKYLEIARALANGIIKMKTVSGGFIHVLTYPSYEIKDLYRIIYYEGEAIFSLLRLYAIDRDDRWLNEAKKSFDYFIRNDYWKHHDHWLSYAANEITDYLPEDQYFIFGLKNCHAKLDFIYHRETTYPTFLELTMAAYKMIKKIKAQEKDYLLEHIDEDFLEETIDWRAEYQRVGFFYPELAMYTKNPELILHSFFIRHHSFRVRIDDIEHYLSGYIQYLLHRLPDVKKQPVRPA